MKDIKFVLASKSPRRRQLLSRLDLNFEVHPSQVDESKYFHENPREHVMKLAEMKAKEVFDDFNSKKVLVLAADTIVSFKKEILEKPESLEEAENMLERLRGSEHEVITGICLLEKNGQDYSTIIDFETTEVFMRDFSKAELKGYINSHEPLGKAGAYAIQGLGSLLVKKIDGSYFNVVGLPLSLLGEKLSDRGLGILEYQSYSS